MRDPWRGPAGVNKLLTPAIVAWAGDRPSQPLRAPIINDQVSLSVARDDLALAMHGGIGYRIAGLATHQDRRPSPFDGSAASPTWCRLADPDTAQTREWFAQRAVAIDDQQ